VSFPPPLPAALYQGSVNTWECDDGGHLNMRFHLERAFAGLALMANQLTLKRAFTSNAETTLVVREAHLRFLKEARPGAPLSMHGGVLGIDNTGAAICLDMRHAGGAPSSVFTFFVDHVDARTFRPTEWGRGATAAGERLACIAPPHSEPRSIDMRAAPSEAHIHKAREIGAARIGGALVTPDQCDAFGRLRGEHIAGRVSDSVPNFLSRWRHETAGDNAAAAAGAVVEARIVFRAWPRAGDLIEVYTGVAEVGEKTLRLVHWLCDPESGAAWASMEAVALTFDTATRKTITPSPEVRARMQARAVKIAP
jgi:acyl-CoA thioester hydrolase